MLKYLAIGVMSFILMSLKVAGGYLDAKIEYNAAKTKYASVSIAMELHKDSPRLLQNYTRVAMRSCLEAETQGVLPNYVVNFAADTALKGMIFASENNLKSLDDPRVLDFVAASTDDINDKAEIIENRLVSETLTVQKDVMTAIEAMATKRDEISLCVYDGIAEKATERSTTASSKAAAEKLPESQLRTDRKTP